LTIPFATPPHFIHGLHPLEEKESLWCLFSGDQILVTADEKKLPSMNSLPLLRSLYLGTFEEKNLFAGEALEAQTVLGHIWISMRSLHGLMDETWYAIAGRAASLLHWDRTHSYCGKCGSGVFSRNQERCKECSRCGHLSYPNMAPAVMVLVKKEEKILLARSPHFPEKLYSVLAGFVDPGETLEQCVIREVFEEVGIEIKNLRYFGSQPWPFSHSLMIGFTSDWKSGEIRIDPLEIEDAAWFDRSDMPMIPTKISLARFLIDQAFS
jgi:NAD+ diphosphatase